MPNLDTCSPQPHDCIQDILPGYLHKDHVALLTGPPYVGKSRFILWLIHNACLGKESFWGQIPPLRIALLTERTTKLVMSQFAGLNVGVPNPEQFRIFSLADSGKIVYLEFKVDPIAKMNKLLDGFQPDIIILDTVIHFLPNLQKTNVNDYSSMADRFMLLQIWASTNHFAVLGIHHTAKEREGNGYLKTLEKTLGSQAITGNTTAMWNLSPLYDEAIDDIAYLRLQVDTHARIKPEDIYLKVPPDSPFEVVSLNDLPAPPANAKVKGSIQNLVIECLPNNEEVSCPDLVTSVQCHVNVDKSNVYRAIRVLLDKHLIAEREDDEGIRFIRKLLT